MSVVSPISPPMTPKPESNKVKVPGKTESSVVEVSLKHVLFGLTILFTGVFITTTGIILVREQARYKRQQAMLDSALAIINTFNRKENHEKK